MLHGHLPGFFILHYLSGTMYRKSNILKTLEVSQNKIIRIQEAQKSTFVQKVDFA